MKNKTFTAFIGLVALVVIVLLASIPIRRMLRLHSLEDEVRNVSWPQGVEIISIKSGIGDSGGNGNQKSLRVVLLVYTELDLDTLEAEIQNLNLYFPEHYKYNGVPIIFVTPYNGSVFQSPNSFSLSFEDVAPITDSSHYYYIEFVE